MTRAVLLALAMIVCASASRADDPIQHPYQWEFITTCSTAGDCNLIFNGSGERILILHAACFFKMAAEGHIYEAWLGDTGNSTPPNGYKNPLSLINYGKDSKGLINYGINAQTYLFYDVGQVPQIHLKSEDAPVGQISCTISGYTQ